jgi:hypothetical protein
MIDLEELFWLLSDYLDEELESDLCAEINQLINDDLDCLAFFNTFNKTLELCRELEELEEEEIEVPQEIHIKLYESLKIEFRKKR